MKTKTFLKKFKLKKIKDKLSTKDKAKVFAGMLVVKKMCEEVFL